MGDSIAAFGSVTAANFTGLSSIGGLVQHSRGVRRGKEEREGVCVCVCVCERKVSMSSPALPASSTADGLETWSVQASPPITHTPTLARTRPARVSLTLFTGHWSSILQPPFTC